MRQPNHSIWANESATVPANLDCTSNGLRKPIADVVVAGAGAVVAVVVVVVIVVFAAVNNRWRRLIYCCVHKTSSHDHYK